MQSKGKSLATMGKGIGATLLVASFVGCSHSSSDGTASINRSAVESAVSSSGTMECTDVAGQPISAFLTNDAPTMNGSFFPHGFTPSPSQPVPINDVAPTCDNPLAMPGVAAGGAVHYQSYDFANSGDVAACIAVQFDLGFLRNGPRFDTLSGVETLAYLDSFDPADITKNYLADFFGLDYGDGTPGNSTLDFNSGSAGIMAEFSFKVPAHAKFVVVVSGTEAPPEDVFPDQLPLLFPYTLAVTNCGQSAADGGTSDAGTSSSGGGNDAGGGNGKTW
jgi:hypothetical protein